MSRKPKSTNADPDLAAWCAALANQAEPDTVPPGWHTAIELGQMLGKDRSTITGLLQVAIRDGRCEAKKFRIKAGQRGLYPTPHYKLVGK